MKSALLGICLTLLLVVVGSNALSWRPPAPTRMSSYMCRSRGRPCDIDCPAGRERDSRGCLTCTCKARPRCKGIGKCARFCINGYAVTSQGCTTCRCKRILTPRPCRQVNCYNRCPGGFSKDYNGCKTCRCNRNYFPVRPHRAIA
ncbi:hypothetical protein SNE40_017098 [Patella caerulea]|uniref:Antistasin-like domain-containing protein n=1 Tax=Patella caerulea TaxID=87958 RepID=A0AAN8JD24_PATCE